MPPPHPGQPPHGRPDPPTAPGSRPGARSNPNDPALAPTAVGSGSAPIGSGTFSGPQPGNFVGPYQVVRRLAAGGMGVVYVARHPGLNRQVALKLMRAGVGQHELERFRIEAQASARLQHPNIVAVHDVGMVAGMPYLVMDLIEGRSLKDIIKDDGPLDPDDAARVLAKLAEGVAYAHARSILHRDIKPHNVLVDSAGEPKLTDFGLAKDVSTEDQGLTVSGQVVGTPAYMPPEQAEGDLELVDRRADIYSLGATLYESLTGKPVFEGATTANILFKVLSKDPVAPRKLRPELSVDMETICLKCLEKEPEARYPTAQALADDLQRYLADEPIEARPVGLLERLGRKARRNRRVTQGFALFTLALIAALLAAALQYRALAESHERESEAAKIAKANALEVKEAAEAKELDKRRQTVIAEARAALEQGYSLLAQNRLTGALTAFESTARHLLAAEVELGAEGKKIAAASRRGAEVALGARARLQTLALHEGTPYGTVCAWSGGTVAYAFPAAEDHQRARVHLVEAATGTVLRTLEAPFSTALSLRMQPVTGDRMGSRTGELLAVVTTDRSGLKGELTLFRTTSGRVALRVPLEGTLRAGLLRFSPDGRLLIAPSKEPKVIDVLAGRVLHALDSRTRSSRNPYHANATSASFLPRAPDVLAIGYDDGTVGVWNARTGRLGIPFLTVHPVQQLGAVMGVALVPFDRWGVNLITAGADGMVKAWVVPRLLTERQLRGLNPSVRKRRITPYSRPLFAGSAGAVARFDHDAKRLLIAVGFDDGRVRVFSHIRRQVQVLDVGGTTAFGLSMHPSGHSLVTGCQGRVDTWDLRRKATMVSKRTRGGPVAFGSGRYLVFFSQDEAPSPRGPILTLQVKIADLVGGESNWLKHCDVARLSHAANDLLKLTGLLLTPDDRTIVLSIDADQQALQQYNVVWAYDRASTRSVGELKRANVQSIAALSADRILVGTTAGGASGASVPILCSVQELSLPGLRPGPTYTWHIASTNAISVRGDTFLTSSEDGTAALWRRGEASPLRVFAPGQGLRSGFSRRRMHGAPPRTPAEAKERWRLTLDPGGSQTAPSRARFAVEGVHGAGLHPTGRRLLTGSADGVLRTWDAQPDGDYAKSGTPVTGSGDRILYADYATEDIAVTAGGDEVRVWDAHTWRVLRVLRAEGPIVSVAVSPDGRWVAASCLESKDSMVNVWSLQSVSIPGFEQNPEQALANQRAPKRSWSD